MILVADSGSTKADWILNFKDQTSKVVFTTKGINPFFQTEKSIIKILNRSPQIQPFLNEITEVYFFGSGCSSPDSRELISNALSQVFPFAFINVENDITGAVYATCGVNPGLCCILGTGSNISFYDGQTVFPGNHGLGYILGDEGSGTFFGKKLITDYLYKKMPGNIHKAFSEAYNIDKETVIKEVYSLESPNFYLASFAKFLSDFKDEQYVLELIHSGFDEFIQSNVKSYPDYRRYPCHFIGSIAFYFGNILQQVCKQ
ncbi:MAG: N-acetylglucosamine kinase, partial [Daejeonella sp.]